MYFLFQKVIIQFWDLRSDILSKGSEAEPHFSKVSDSDPQKFQQCWIRIHIVHRVGSGLRNGSDLDPLPLPWPRESETEIAPSIIASLDIYRSSPRRLLSCMEAALEQFQIHYNAFLYSKIFFKNQKMSQDFLDRQ